MKHLRRITISNARRFGKDVEIDFGSGANIILAPNGTGKTTLFEAIEFALTGSIQRLNNPPLSLIRERQESVDVRLDFDDDVYCEVNFRKGKDPILNGNHNLIYPNRKAAEIPYLLRLTHLLEQRGSNWFVQQRNSSDAGLLLDKLSLGKDINAIIKTKTNTLNAATRAIGKTNDDLEEAQKRVSIFEEKLNERKSAMVDYVLRPLKDLLADINVISKTVDSNASQGDGEKIEALLAFAAQVNAILLDAIALNSQLQVKLAKLENKIEIFIKNKTNIQFKHDSVDKQREILENIEAKLIELRDVNVQKETQLKEYRNELAMLTELKELLENHKTELLNHSKIATELAEQSEILTRKRQALQVTINSLEAINNLFSQHRVFRTRESELLSKQGELLSLKPLIGDWINHEALITNNEIVVLPKLYEEKNLLEKSTLSIQHELDVVENDFGNSRQRLNSLKNISDAIQSAVGIISANLPESQGNCPVCDAIYQPFELREKINKALIEVDPVLKAEIEENKLLQERVNLITNDLNKEKLNLERVQKEIAKQTENVRSAKKAINERCIPKFSNCKTLQEAEEWLRNEEGKVHVDLIRILNEQKTLLPEPTSEQSDETSLKKQMEITEIETIESNIRSLSMKLSMSDEKLTPFNQRLGDTTLEELTKDILEVARVIEEFSKELLDKRKEQENSERQREAVSKQILSEEEFISQTIGQQNGLLTEWRDMKLEGEPSLDLFIKKRESLLEREKSLTMSRDELSKINGELGRWKIAERFEKISKEIKDACGDLSEDAYLQGLQLELKEVKGRFDIISEKKQVLDKLYSKIGNEVVSVHQQIVTINPLWVSLLKKVVINPRFIETTLSSYPYRNQPHAKVEVALHDTKVSVMDVASEAQATDLQLTFMLSMASSYQWTPWKALLLDDPTQHHDLVHAAGVFDLLRDYIVDQDFQILLGTHDSVQAHFFQRKLQNDGVAVKLWSLIADSSGVRAECL